ncbi:MAG: hypothetical protein ABSH08_20930, partial [Tepidisphaeraceae bacterium]
AFVLGIWTILDLGSAFLTAPRDLTGTWRLLNPPTSSPRQSESFSIAQSGKFLRFAFEAGPQFDVVLASASDHGYQTLTFEGNGWHVTGVGSPVGENMTFTFQPPSPRQAPLSGTYQRQRIGSESSGSPNAGH